MYAPSIDPTIFSLGPLQVRWYGLMYVIGFLIAGQIAKYLANKKFIDIDEKKVDSLVTHLIIFMFIFSRLTYVFVYNFDYYQNHLSELFSVWRGGLSFHGAVVGMAIGSIVFAKKSKVSAWKVMDVIALSGTQGLFWGRIGNFINHELYGRISDSPFAMIFPAAGPYPRHPSQLYEAVFEGLILAAFLWIIKRKVQHLTGILTASFITGYGFFRYFIEFFREPDRQLGYFFGNTTTMGQILCLIMIVVGTGLIFYFKKTNTQHS